MKSLSQTGHTDERIELLLDVVETSLKDLSNAVANQNNDIIAIHRWNNMCNQDPKYSLIWKMNGPNEH